MHELRLAGIHDDGENLILEAADGTTYLLPIDQNLRQSIARARRIHPLRGGSSGTFGPRDIQARFRQGATVEEIAAESGWEPERVRRYEWPIVAERANIIHTARTVVIAPAPGQSGSAQSLNEHIEAVSHRYGFDQSPMNWTTWQQESGQWTISLEVKLDEDVTRGLPRTVMFPARWNFNPANQSIYASNEAAYFLMGRDHSQDSPIPDSPIPGSPPAAGTEVAASGSSAPPAESIESQHVGVQVGEPSITRVRIPVHKEQNELLDELTARRGVRSFDPASERKLADLLERARRSSRTVPLVSAARPGEHEPADAGSVEKPLPETAQVKDSPQLARVDDAPRHADPSLHADAEETTTAPDSQPHTTTGNHENTAEAEPEATGRVHTQPVQSQQITDNEPISQGEHLSSSDHQRPAEATEQAQVAEQAEAIEEAEETAKPQTARPARAKRTSVPSWDDIIFGSQRR
ncbi:hypothetical protein A7979_02165 [Rothia nasimurium]|uniref:DUF3071 domain-containing protein n=1 Tax=Rothia nasimurium TaxID=85336 RepID=A0A1Y1RQQ1_9MICC|nr:septation protein SepH [Rothia nasimurium]ORC18827.1 hypothetical protein A7979_02165 [Rothia nasimurium]